MKKGQTITLANYKTTVTNGTYNFASLTASTSGGTAATTTTMGTNTTIALYYSRNKFDVELTAGDYISEVTGAGEYKVGESVTISATVATASTGYNYNWSGWTGTYTSSVNPYTFTMPASKVELTANGNRTSITYVINLDNQSATTAGSTAVYLKYGTGIYKESGCTTKMTTSANAITVPTKTGWNFGGYYTSQYGEGTQMINASGYITSSFSTTSFSSTGTLYAKWYCNNTTRGSKEVCGGTSFTEVSRILDIPEDGYGVKVYVTYFKCNRCNEVTYLTSNTDYPTTPPNSCEKENYFYRCTEHLYKGINSTHSDNIQECSNTTYKSVACGGTSFTNVANSTNNPAAGVTLYISTYRCNTCNNTQTLTSTSGTPSAPSSCTSTSYKYVCTEHEYTGDDKTHIYVEK